MWYVAMIVMLAQSSVRGIVAVPFDAFERLHWGMTLAETRTSQWRGEPLVQLRDRETGEPLKSNGQITFTRTDSAFGFLLNETLRFSEKDSALTGITFVRFALTLLPGSSSKENDSIWVRVQRRYGAVPEKLGPKGLRTRQWGLPGTRIIAARLDGEASMVSVTFARLTMTQDVR